MAKHDKKPKRTDELPVSGEQIEYGYTAIFELLQKWRQRDDNRQSAQRDESDT